MHYIPTLIFSQGRARAKLFTEIGWRRKTGPSWTVKDMALGRSKTFYFIAMSWVIFHLLIHSFTLSNTIASPYLTAKFPVICLVDKDGSRTGILVGHWRGYAAFSKIRKNKRLEQSTQQLFLRVNRTPGKPHLSNKFNKATKLPLYMFGSTLLPPVYVRPHQLIISTIKRLSTCLCAVSWMAQTNGHQLTSAQTFF